ncbi:MAG TPA: VWA domain-containing protein [Thermoanaerobaculia bacterium]|nr:VWA domain-containing protein [Thermoanaerobaculia bacterium]
MTPPRRYLFLLTLFLLLPFSFLEAQGLQENDPAIWPEPERSFYQDGPALLLSPEQRTELRSLNPEARARWIQEFLEKDPIPGTPANELKEGIERRRLLAADQYMTPQDARAQILFLQGMPFDRLIVDCGSVFAPMEIWTYRRGTGADGKPLERQLVVYRPKAGELYRLWIPSDSKRVLYTKQIEYWLEQWEELRGRIRAVRFDIQNCKEAKKVDEATGIPGLTGALPGGGERLRPKDASDLLEPPSDLARWAGEAVKTEVPASAPPLKIASASFKFPERDGQRLVARALLTLPQDAGFQPVEEQGQAPSVRVVVEGLVEQDGKPFEEFRMRFILPRHKGEEPIVLPLDRLLRPKTNYVVRLRIRDEGSGAEARIARGFRVPAEPTPEPLPPGAATGQLVPTTAAAGPDSLLLLPPPDDILIGLWRTEALVTGERIHKVTFLVDGKPQLSTTKKPFSAEVRLERYPTEQTVRAEGYDAEGKLVAADEVVLNQPRGALAVRIVSPLKGAKVQAATQAKAEVVVPDGRKIQTVEFRVNDEPVASMVKPPYEARINVPDGDLVYLTVVAVLDDGSRAEAVRYLRSPEYVSEVEVSLVEMYVAATDRSGNLVRDLKQTDFEISEAGKPQEISKFELVQNLPLVVGVLLDTSGSMAGAMVDTQKAASDFLQSVMTPRDRSFAVSFSRRPRLEMPPTDDVDAVIQALNGLQAIGDTALHDALVHSLYYFRGLQGQKALVLLSDGDDNASYIKYQEALEYARRSGVTIYAIGLNVSAWDATLRGKLGELAEATGGRAFWSDKPEELAAAYKQIENELRSRYLVAYSSSEAGQTGFRPVEVKVKRSGLKVRTARGYYQ